VREEVVVGSSFFGEHVLHPTPASLRAQHHTPNTQQAKRICMAGSQEDRLLSTGPTAAAAAASVTATTSSLPPSPLRAPAPNSVGGAKEEGGNMEQEKQEELIDDKDDDNMRRFPKLRALVERRYVMW
jgi:hypothetical protein